MVRYVFILYELIWWYYCYKWLQLMLRQPQVSELRQSLSYSCWISYNSTGQLCYKVTVLKFYNITFLVAAPAHSNLIVIFSIYTHSNVCHLSMVHHPSVVWKKYNDTRQDTVHLISPMYTNNPIIEWYHHEYSLYVSILLITVPPLVHKYIIVNIKKMHQSGR